MAQGLGLLHDLLEHEVLIAALLRRPDLPVHVGDLLLNGLHEGVVALDAVPGQHRRLAVVHVGHLAGVADDGGHVAGQKHAVLAVAQNQRAVLADGDDPIRLVGADDAQGVGALNAPQAAAHGLQQAHPAGVHKVLHQLGHYLGVGLRDEADPLPLEKRLQLGVVLDDAVVHHGDLAAAADLGVGIHVRGRAVGGPPGVAHAHGAGHRRARVQHVAEDLEPALGLMDGELFRPPVVHRHAGGVVAPVLQLAQSVQQNGGRLAAAHVSDNTTHIL